VDYSIEQIKLATCLQQVLYVICVVAITAFFAKSRCLFFFGTIGSFLGFFIPEPWIESICSDAEAAFMVGIEDTADHVMSWGIAGAILGSAIGYALTRWIYQEDYQQRQQPIKNAALGGQPADDESGGTHPN
jgi:hypothetical protein